MYPSNSRTKKYRPRNYPYHIRKNIPPSVYRQQLIPYHRSSSTTNNDGLLSFHHRTYTTTKDDTSLPSLDTIFTLLPSSLHDTVRNLIYERITIIVEALHPSGYTKMRRILPSHNPSSPTSRNTSSNNTVVVPSTAGIALSTLSTSLHRNTSALRQLIGPVFTGYIIRIVNQWDQLPFFRIHRNEDEEKIGKDEDIDKDDTDSTVSSNYVSHPLALIHSEYMNGKTTSTTSDSINHPSYTAAYQQQQQQRKGQHHPNPSHSTTYRYSRYPYDPATVDTRNDDHLLSQLVASIIPDNDSNEHNYVYLQDYIDSGTDTIPTDNDTYDQHQMEVYNYLRNETDEYYQQYLPSSVERSSTPSSYPYHPHNDDKKEVDVDDLQYKTELLRIADIRSPSSRSTDTTGNERTYPRSSPTTIRPSASAELDLLQHHIQTIISSPPPPPPFTHPPVSQPRIASSPSSSSTTTISSPPSFHPSSSLYPSSPLGQVFASSSAATRIPSSSSSSSASLASPAVLSRTIIPNTSKISSSTFPSSSPTTNPNDTMYDAILLTQLNQIGSIMGLVQPKRMTNDLLTIPPLSPTMTSRSPSIDHSSA